MAQVSNGNGNEQHNVSNGNGVKGTESTSEQMPKDILAYEDGWIGWDGPVWCSRYGRFESQEDASVDDGYTIEGQPPHHNLERQRCKKHGCDCRVPFQHRSYVHDIQRRLEPMVASLVRLEHQVGTLAHHFIQKESKASAQDTNGDGNEHVEGGLVELYSTTHVNDTPKITSGTDQTQQSTGIIKEGFEKLEARVESLMHQVHQLMHHQGHHITEKEPDFYQGES